MVPAIEPKLEDRGVLSYFLGVWLGDASSNDVSITLQITPRDEAFGRSFCDSMGKLGLNPKMKCYEFKANGFRKRSASYLVVPTWVLDKFARERRQREETYKLLHEKYVMEKMSITETAESIGKGRKFVEYWLKKLEIPTRGEAYRNEMKRKALNLRDAGMTYKQVGRELGISAPTVCVWSKVR